MIIPMPSVPCQSRRKNGPRNRLDCLAEAGENPRILSSEVQTERKAGRCMEWTFIGVFDLIVIVLG